MPCKTFQKIWLETSKTFCFSLRASYVNIPEKFMEAKYEKETSANVKEVLRAERKARLAKTDGKRGRGGVAIMRDLKTAIRPSMTHDEVWALPEAKLAKLVLACYLKGVAKHTPSTETKLPTVLFFFFQGR